MSRRLGNHRVRPALSTAARAKAEILSKRARLEQARRIGAAAVEIEKLETDLAWLIANSLR